MNLMKSTKVMIERWPTRPSAALLLAGFSRCCHHVAAQTLLHVTWVMPEDFADFAAESRGGGESLKLGGQHFMCLYDCDGEEEYSG